MMTSSLTTRKSFTLIQACAFLLVVGCLEAQTSLRSIAEAKGKLVGTALTNNYITDPSSMPADYHTTVVNEFNVYVAENAFKMSSLLKNAPADPFNIQISDINTSKIDNLVARAQANGVDKVRGHVLIWHNQAPSWLATAAPGWTSAQLTTFATSYITAVISYCKSINDAPGAPVQIYEWDVVNETINGSPANYRNGTWYDGVSDKQVFIDACFQAARDTDPSVRLMYNDYAIELSGTSKNAFMLSMVAGMVSRGVPIDGVGLQCHFTGPNQSGTGGFTSSSATKFANTFVALDALGLDCIVTELDLRLRTDSSTEEGNVTSQQLALQGEQYELIATTALSQPNCPAFLVWGFTDAYSWIPKSTSFSGYGHALPFDHSYAKKPAYDGIINALALLPSETNFASLLATQRIEFEDYRGGTNGVDYYDTSAGNTGGSYRADDVDISTYGTDYAISYITAGEWLEYDADIPATGTYRIAIRTTSGSANNTVLRFAVDGTTVGDFTLTPTGGWNNWAEQTATFTLPATFSARIRVSVISGASNVDWFELQPLEIYNIDGDGDGIADNWEQFYAGNISLLDAFSDPDGNGQNNLIEYALASVPLSLEPGMLRYHRRLSAALANRVQLLSSPDLVTWTEINPPSTSSLVSQDIEEISIPLTATESAMFFRLAVVPETPQVP